MSERKINLEAITSKHYNLNKDEDGNAVFFEWEVIKAMKEAVKQALELAAINIKLDAMETYGTDIPDCWDIDSITNTLNQIE